jgi:hypothetical protein
VRYFRITIVVLVRDSGDRRATLKCIDEYNKAIPVRAAAGTIVIQKCPLPFEGIVRNPSGRSTIRCNTSRTTTTIKHSIIAEIFTQACSVKGTQSLAIVTLLLFRTSSCSSLLE